jgi:predicted MPP superfamily phosphohydrolase
MFIGLCVLRNGFGYVKKYKKLLILSAVILIFIVADAAFFWCEDNLLEVTHISVASAKLPKSFDGYRIVQLTDLHSKTFGPGNRELIDRINAIDPDLIVVTGDMMNSEKDDGRVFEALAAALVKKYPVYCISGNHEDRIEYNDNKHIFADFKAKLVSMGVKYIDNGSAQIVKGGESFSLYGLEIPLSFYGLGFSGDKTGKDGFTKEEITQRLGSPDPARFNLLLVHTPFYFGSYAAWGADLSLAGHLHGGVIRLPFLGGVISPDMTLFPKYDAGEFSQGGAKMIVGRGLGTSVLSLRIFNRPEIMAVTLKSGT